ncbi:MAG: hypothetical protein ACRD9L_10640, partial [Bryobacteraceae bacterium]
QSMALGRIFACLLLSVPGAAVSAMPVEGVPTFTRDDVRPMWGRHAEALRAKMLVSIYGQNLTPADGCGQEPLVPLNGPYPEERCGVRVLVAGRPAGLLTVRSTQINFQIPADAPASGEAAIEVVVGRTKSAPVTVAFGAPRVRLSLVAPAYVGMPVWIAVERPYPYEVYYPYSLNPWNFGGGEFEVKRNGVSLKPIHHASGPEAVNGLLNGTLAPAGSPQSRLPLHLAYRLDEPGTYAVRFTGYRWREDASGERREQVDQSGWFEFSVLPFDAARRQHWLREELARIPEATPGELAGDILPSLLASPDESVLAAMLQALSNPNEIVRGFARRSLGGFDRASLRQRGRETSARGGQ